MTADAASWPVWAVVLACGAANQTVKLLLNLAAGRRPAWPALLESVGLPSLHGAVMTCWTALLGLRAGWGAPETSLALVFATIVVHDSVRFKGTAQEQREVLWTLIVDLPGEHRLRGAAASLRRVWAHRPFHVATGALFGLLFALMFEVAA